MPLQCWTRQGGATGQYVTCKNTGENNNLKNKSKKNIPTKKMPPKKQAKTIDEEINNLMNTPSMKKVNAKKTMPRPKTPPKKKAPALVRPTTPKRTARQKRPVRTSTPVKKRPGTPPRTNAQKLADAVPTGVPPEVLKKLPPAKTEKNKMFLGYVTDNRPISFKKDVNKKGKSLERYNKYKSAKTVVAMLRTGGTFYDFINDVEKGIITVGAKKRPVVQAKVTLKPGMKLTKSKFQQQEMLDKGKVTIKKSKKNLLKKGENI